MYAILPANELLFYMYNKKTLSKKLKNVDTKQKKIGTIKIQLTIPINAISMIKL